MVKIVIDKNELKIVVKESVCEVINKELMKFRALLLSYVSLKEQKNIEKLYGKPSRKVAKSIEIKI
jgi:hypothetical protein